MDACSRFQTPAWERVGARLRLARLDPGQSREPIEIDWIRVRFGQQPDRLVKAWEFEEETNE